MFHVKHSQSKSDLGQMFHVKHFKFDKLARKALNRIVKKLGFGKTNTAEVVSAQNPAINFMYMPMEKASQTCYYIITDRAGGEL